ncbi:PH domain-containing protein [Halosimplex sp. J119]
MALIVGAGTWAFAYEFLPLGRLQGAAAVAVAVFAVFTIYGIARSILLYRSWRYVVREESLYLSRGVFTKVQTVVPYVRVQHIDTRRSAFERVLGLSTLVVYTAGSRGADVTIPGLRPEVAEDLQSRLERLAIASEDEDAV